MPEIIVKLGDRIIQRYYFDKEMLSVGRARDNDIVIENLSVSRNHARIKKQDGRYFLTDMNSANGTLINGVRVTKTEIFHDDQISVGKHTLHFISSEDAGVLDSPAGPSTPPLITPSAIPSSGLVGVMVVTKGKQSGQEFRLVAPETSIGRANENDIRLHDWFVSKKHAAIERRGEAYVLKDLDSWRGTTVNGNTVREIELGDNDEVVFGTTVLKFSRVDAAELAKPPAKPANPIPEEEWESKPDAAAEAELRRQHEEAPSIKMDRNSGSRGPFPVGIGAHATSDENKRISATEAPIPDEEDDAPIRIETQFEDDEPLVPLADKPEDEYAPMTMDELEALEQDADLSMGSDDEEEESRKATWELLEAEKMFEQSGASEKFSLIDPDRKLRSEEEKAVADNFGHTGSRMVDKDILADAPDDDIEDEEEEKALYGKPMSPVGPFGEPEQDVEKESEEDENARAARSEPSINLALSKEVEMWEKAMRNKSVIIRKNAAKELKKLTGKDYDWKSEPAGS